MQITLGISNTTKTCPQSGQHEKIFIPVGIAIIQVGSCKNMHEYQHTNPTVYIWCAQTINPKISYRTIA